MESKLSSRRDFLKATAAGAVAVSIPPVFADDEQTLAIDPKPRFELSPYLYMQFMEPLGTTDGSVAAAWDFKRDCWRSDVVEVTRELGPTLMRWGGCFSSYYRWMEAAGPRDKRVPMINLLWGGIESNQVGTGEFVDFCRQTGCEPLMSVNFESDGRKQWQKDPKGSVRSADAKEAAAWVRYCNNPGSKLRLAHGVKEPHNIKMWQIGNETSYDRNGFDCEAAGRKTIDFAKAMRREDAGIKLIGWGDSGWAPRMLDMAGEHLDYIAFHHMFNPYGNMKDSPLHGIEYRKDPARTWEHLMNACRPHEAKIKQIVDETKGSKVPLAMTECHFSLPGRNRCEVLSSWAAGVANARLLNVHERYGERLKIATLADFCGTRWQVNAIMIPVPSGKAFMMPVARVMSLYRHHTGSEAIQITNAPDGLDVTASRTGNRIFIHAINTKRTESVTAKLAIGGAGIKSGRIFELAADPEVEVIQTNPNAIKHTEINLPQTGKWTFPPASVSAMELEI